MNPKIVERPAMHVVGLAGRFTPATMGQIGAMWGRFAPQIASIAGRRGIGTSYGVCLPDPIGARGEPALEYTACVEVASLDAMPKGMVGFTVPAGRYAVFTHTGPIHTIGTTWDAIHERWLPEAGLVKAPGPDFETYDARWDPRTGEGPVDIYVPIQRPK
jgi:AraC family transcriptional regulator